MINRWNCRALAWFALIGAAFLACAVASRTATAEANRKTLVIAYANHLEETAKLWSEYRTSPAGGEWRVTLHAVQPVAEGQFASQRNSLREFLRKSYRDAFPQKGGEGDFAVLLLGDADANGIATWNFAQRDPVLQGHNDNGEFVSDHPYQVMSDKAFSPDFALGRIP